MNGVCVWGGALRVHDGIDSCKANAARTFHAPKGMGACNEASRQGHGLEHGEELSRNFR